MKCNNCKWPNRPGEKNCIKCGAPLIDTYAPMPNSQLSDSPTGGIDSNPTVLNMGNRDQMQQAAPMQEAAAPRPEAFPPRQPMRPAQPRNSHICPRCGYALMPGMTQCPNCSYQLTPQTPPRQEQPQFPPQGDPRFREQAGQQFAPPAPAPMPGPAPDRRPPRPTEVRNIPANPAPDRSNPNPGRPAPAVSTDDPVPSVVQLTPPPGFRPQTSGHHPTEVTPHQIPGNRPPQEATPAQAQPLHHGTVNIYTSPAACETLPSFSLTPVKKINEPAQPAPLEFKGQEAILNRANADPENLSITSRQQASIANIDGKWVITDLSDQQTTFVHPAPGHELKDGDMVLLGNRLFIFHA